MSFRFSWVLIFLLVQCALCLFSYFKNYKSGPIFPNSSNRVDNVIQKNINTTFIQWKNRIILFGLTILTLAASGPQIGTRVRPLERKGVDLVIALDTSTSMDAEDVTPSRLEKAKFEIGRLIHHLKGDRVAIIVFAGSSHLYLPLTTDYEAAMLFLREIDTNMIPTQGTALSAAMNTALTAFADNSDKFKVMLIVSDGEDHEGEAINLASKASEMGMMINTVGVGSKNGSLIPIKVKNKKTSKYKRGKDGKLITSTLNETILKDIALAGEGSFFWFGNSKDTYLQIAESIEKMEKKTISTHEFSEYEDRYQPFAMVAFCLLVIAFIIPTREFKKS